MRNAKALAYYTAITGAALGLAADEVGEIGSSRLMHRSSLHDMAWHTRGRAAVGARPLVVVAVVVAVDAHDRLLRKHLQEEEDEE